MMNQEEFEATCIEIRTQLKRVISGVITERDNAKRKLKADIQLIQKEKDLAITRFRNEIYDLATAWHPRSSGFIAGQAEAKIKRDAELTRLDDKAHKLEDEFFEKSQEWRKISDRAKRDAEVKRSEAIRSHSEWIEKRRAEKAMQEGGN